MKNKILTGLLLLSMVTGFYACNQKQENKNTDPTTEEEKIKAEIQALENHFALIYNTKNADSLNYYADDAVSYFNNQKPIAGKAAIHQYIENELVNFPAGAKISFETREIYIGKDGRYVFEIGAYNIDSSGVILSQGNYFSLFEKKDGKYQCIRDMANSYPVDI